MAKIGCKKCGEILDDHENIDITWCKCNTIGIYKGKTNTRVFGDFEDFTWVETDPEIK